MVGVALVIVMNYQSNVATQDEIREEMPEIEVMTPEEIVMQSGETKVIPFEVRIISKEPLEARIVAFSTTPETAEAETTMSDSLDLDGLFDELRLKGFTDSFEGSLDIESLSTAGNSDGDVTIETVNFTLKAPSEIAAGDYYFGHSVLGDTMTWDFVSSGMFVVTIN